MSAIRRCPDCGEEFRPGIAVCSDCGAELVDARDDLPEAPAAAVPTLDDLEPVFSTVERDDLRDAAEGLAAAGVGFKVTGSALNFVVLVAPEDYARAAQVLAGRPGVVSFTAEMEPAAQAEAAPCPACGTIVAAGVAECPECQLGLGEAAAACATCSAPVRLGEVRCEACGAATGD